MSILLYETHPRLRSGKNVSLKMQLEKKIRLHIPALTFIQDCLGSEVLQEKQRRVLSGGCDLESTREQKKKGWKIENEEGIEREKD